MLSKWITISCSALFLSLDLIGQEGNNRVPPIKLLRAEESYLFLQETEQNQVFLQPLKLIEVDASKGIFLTFGGEYRARFESFTNEGYSSENDAYFSQRLSLHASLRLGSSVRFFGELYHGLTSGEARILEDDEIDLHQVSYFIAGKFIEATGDAENIFYIAPTLDFKF